MGDEFSLEDVLIVLRRRFFYFVVPILVIVPVGFAIIMMLPPLFTAQGKILVESQQISEALVRSTTTAFAEERIQTIRQRVMTRARLLEIAEKFDLFSNETGLSEGARVQRMRNAFDMNLISATPGNRRRRNQPANTIGINVSYTDRSPDRAFQVTNELMTLILSEDVRTRTEGASSATEFFAQESRRLAEAIDKSEAQIADFKAKNADALPENLALNRQTLIRSQEDLSRTESAITQAEDEMTALQTQMATYLAGTGGSAGGPAQEILRLKTQLAALRAAKTEAHPDVIAMREQIASLERQLSPSAAIQKLRAELAAADDALRAARAQTPVDDEIITQRRRESADARQRLSDQISSEAAAGSADLVMTQMQGRLDMAGSRHATLLDKVDSLKATIDDMNDRIARTPLVERGLSTLTRDIQNLHNEYQALKNKQATAQLSENLEDNQKAEKFSILESAQRPDSPSSPERGKLMVMLIAASIGIGAIIAFAAEFLSETLRGRSHLVSVIREAPIAVIPYFEAENERRFAGLPVNRRKPA
ncbi:MAG: hypothetical protein KDD85_08755 [Parvularculaceae bacterium]|nr:hypothetical protein [Parvularculaceae bacterium]